MSTPSKSAAFSLPQAYQGLEPAEVWRHFGALNAIPRPSGQEQEVRSHIEQLAQTHNAMWKVDARGNICVRVAARGDRPGAGEGAPILVLQSHLDMVCQKRPEVSFDFEKDPIAPRRMGGNIYASGTTLGADNGLGVALMLAILTSDELQHGPLELLFTVEEETGLYGAAHLDPDLVRGRLLVNLDSEDPDELTIGCAGGAGVTLKLPLEREASTNSLTQQITVGGLQGGHSGVQIHEPLANAIKLLTDVLREVAAGAPSLRLVSIEGGTAHNAIPRDAIALVALNADEFPAFQTALQTAIQGLETQWRSHESGLNVRNSLHPATDLPLNVASTTQVLDLLANLPHGVQKMSGQFAGKVQTSSNLAEVRTHQAELELHVSNRSFLADDIQAMQQQVIQLGHQVGASSEVRDGYPGWEPRAESALREVTAQVWQQELGHLPKIEVVHAGLECGLLSEKLPGLDAVSFGPLIRGAHTPEEYVAIGSVRDIWRVLVRLLEKVG